MFLAFRLDILRYLNMWNIIIGVSLRFNVLVLVKCKYTGLNISVHTIKLIELKDDSIHI